MSATQSDTHKGLLAPKIEGTNPYATRAQNQKITSGLKNTASKAIQPRLMRGNGFAKLCPCDTPEGAQSGKINAMCAGVRLSRGVPFTALRNILLALNSCVRAACVGEGDDSGACTIRGSTGPCGENEVLFGLCLNGSLIARVRCLRAASAEIRHARRRGILPPSVSVAVDRHFKAVMVRCDAGRLLTPMYVAERAEDVEGVLAAARRYGHVNALSALEACGCVEWIDSHEQCEIVLAHSRAQLEAHHTHALLHPTTMLSAVLGHSVLCNHNQTPRSIYFACHHAQTMGWHPMRGPTQDFGIFSSNHWLSLCTPQRPVVRTLVEDVHYAHDLVPVLNGSTVIVGVGALGHNIEDALVFNEASLQRGLFAFQSHHTIVINLPKCSDTFVVRPTIEVAGKKVCASGRDLYHALAHDGLPAVGKTLEPNDVILGKVRAAPSAARHAGEAGGGGEVTAAAGAAGVNTCCSVVTKVGGRVERVHVATTHKAGTIVLVLLTTLCTPSVGDKFTDRSAQKGVIGAILPAIDLPRTLRDGITPDVFFNPAGLISRMTVAKLAEILLGKDALVRGKSFADGTPFMDLQAAAEAATEALRENGYDGTRERMVSGTTGEVMEGFCSVGPLHMCPLKHLAQPKAYARGRTGVNDPFTRRPADGRVKQGGFRVGEMEHAALLSAGASFASNEFVTLANPHVAYVCTQCGRIGSTPPPRAFAVAEQARCGHCGMDGVMEAVDGTFTQFAIFDKTLAALGIRLTYTLRPINARV
jgi:DNA-directed RNA polymerase beta subunit